MFHCPDTGHYGADDSCAAFYLCTGKNSQGIRQECSEGLRWDAKKQICNWARETECDMMNSNSNVGKRRKMSGGRRRKKLKKERSKPMYKYWELGFRR